MARRLPLVPLLTLVVLALGACKHPERKPYSQRKVDVILTHEAALADAQANLICTREIRTGSHIPTHVCRTPQEIERNRLRTQDMLRRAQLGASCSNPTSSQSCFAE